MVKYKEYIPLFLIILLLILSFFIIKPFLQAIFIGALLAYISYSLYKYLVKRTNKEGLSAFLVCLLVFVVIIVPGIFFVKLLVQESYSLFVLGKQKLATGFFTGCQNNFCHAIERLADNPTIEFQAQELLKTATNWFIQKGSNFLLSVPQVILSLFIVFFTMYYFLKDGKKLFSKIHILFGTKQNKYVHVISRLKEIVSGIVYGYLLVAIIQGILGGLGFFFFGVSSPIFWGVVMALLALIPFLGTGVVWVPTSLLIILNGVFQDSNILIAKGIGLFVYSLIFVSSFDNLLKPKLIGERAKVHPAIILIGIFGGIFLFGPVGVLIGPLIFSLLVVLGAAYLKDD